MRFEVIWLIIIRIIYNIIYWLIIIIMIINSIIVLKPLLRKKYLSEEASERRLGALRANVENWAENNLLFSFCP